MLYVGSMSKKKWCSKTGREDEEGAVGQGLSGVKTWRQVVCVVGIAVWKCYFGTGL